MRLTVDTNVLFAALYNAEGASAYILDLVTTGEVSLALSVPTFMEYQDVLLRESNLMRLDIERREMQAVLRFIVDQAQLYDISFLWRPNLRDEADNMFVELAIRSQSHFLITSNIRDFVVDNQLRFNDLRVVTPSQFVRYWRKAHE